MTASILTASIESLTYRQLQYVLKQYDDCGCKRNSKTQVLRVELLRLAVGDATKYERVISEMPAMPTSQSRSKFDWMGLATDRKDAIKTLKVFRSEIPALQSVKLNGTNASLLAALRTIVSDSHQEEEMVTITKTPKARTGERPANTPSQRPSARTVAATAAPKTPVLVVDVDDIDYELTDLVNDEPVHQEGPTLKERAAKLLQARTKWETRLALDGNDVLALEYLTEVNEDLNALPARAFL